MTKVLVIGMAFLCIVLPGVSSADSLKDNGNGTITDSKTHLTWQQEEDGDRMPWKTAIAYCSNLSLAGYNDWRLPNIGELKSLLGKPSIKYNHQKNHADYWSSTTNADFTSHAWIVDFFMGDKVGADKYNLYHVRCVRGGK